MTLNKIISLLFLLVAQTPPEHVSDGKSEVNKTIIATLRIDLWDSMNIQVSIWLRWN